MQCIFVPAGKLVLSKRPCEVQRVKTLCKQEEKNKRNWISIRVKPLQVLVNLLLKINDFIVEKLLFIKTNRIVIIFFRFIMQCYFKLFCSIAGEFRK